MCPTSSTDAPKLLRAATGWLYRHATITFYVLAAVAVVYILLLVDARITAVNTHVVMGAGEMLAAIPIHIADAMLLLLPLVLLPPRLKWLQWLLLWMLAIWAIMVTALTRLL